MRGKGINMTEGVIWKQLVLFSLPMIIGDIFQQFYNTVDSIIVGRFIDRQALAAVSSSSTIITILVGLFAGISTGATIVIARFFGADDRKELKAAVHTTVTLTFLLGVAFTIIGVAATPLMLRLQATPEDVFGPAKTYLQIYFAGIGALIIYNMLGGILRAVGDTRRPLYCLLLCSGMNIVLDILLVIVIPMGVAGAALATIISEFVSAGVLVWILCRSREAYRLEFSALGIRPDLMKKILRIGLPMGLQRSLISVSNLLVNSLVNTWGSGAMAGWGVYRKLDQLVMQIVQNLSMAVSTFVSQNLGAGKQERIRQGGRVTMMMACASTVVLDALLILTHKPVIALFNTDPEVIYYGSMMFYTVLPFQTLTTISQIDSGVLRGYGNSTAPMVITLTTHIGLRLVYLYAAWSVVRSLPVVVSCYPFGWACATIITRIYKNRWMKKHAGQPA